MRGNAKFTGPKEVTVNGEKYTAEHILVATGGHPRMDQNIPGSGRDESIKVKCFHFHQALSMPLAVMGFLN